MNKFIKNILDDADESFITCMSVLMVAAFATAVLVALFVGFIKTFGLPAFLALFFFTAFVRVLFVGFKGKR